MSKTRPSPEPANGPPTADPLESLYRQAVEAIRAGDEGAALEALRQLDEPAPRKVLGYLQLLVSEHARLAPIIEAGQGQAERAAQLDTAVRMLQGTKPADGEQARKIAGDLARLRREQHEASMAASDGANAQMRQGAIEALAPRLFGLPAASQNANAGGVAPPEIVNWQNANNVELDFRDGWAFSRLVAPPPGPRRRLRALK